MSSSSSSSSEHASSSKRPARHFPAPSPTPDGFHVFSKDVRCGGICLGMPVSTTFFQEELWYVISICSRQHKSEGARRYDSW